MTTTTENITVLPIVVGIIFCCRCNFPLYKSNDYGDN